jgi:hypothetical protein
MGTAMAFPATCRLALKEWAVTQQALDRAEQILLLRKGGLREEGKSFDVLQPEFLIYPTYEHQREDLLKTVYRERLSATLAHPHRPDQIVFSHWARVAERIELRETKQLEALSPYYIFTTDYAEARLHWKPRSPLQLLLVRVYRLSKPRSLPYRAAYGGCKSWVALEEAVELGALAPVLNEPQFQARVREIRRALGLQCT